MNNPPRYEAKYLDRVCQGNIYRDVSYIVESKSEDEIVREIVRYIEKFAIVVSQDCDLEWDYNNRAEPRETEGRIEDKYLKNILFCPLYQYESFIKGEHLSEWKRRMRSFYPKERERLRTNQEFRFHFLDKCLDFQIPELVADFKHFFTVERELFYSKYHNTAHYLCSLNPLFREDLSTRFSNFLARIALPD
jgi:hypothetical protein